MNNPLYFLLKLILVTIFFISIVIVSTKCQKLVLKQIVILSRHGIRTPLAKNLGQITPKTWPHWKEKSGYLTTKGAIVEGYMGQYFAEWLKKEEILPEKCPGKDFFVYSNIKERTLKSAEAFVRKAFPGCNITINHSENDTDPIFNPVIQNTSDVFKEIALSEMKETLNNLKLNSSYKLMQVVLDYKDSTECLVEKKCSLVTGLNKIVDIVPGFKPNVVGPLKIGNSAIDAFIMEYYEGFLTKNVAWGQLTDRKWKNIMILSRGYHNVIFNTTSIAKDLSKPLLKYMSEIFLNENSAKVSLLMGHDANLYTVLKGMDFKHYILPEQYESIPVGGKLVFQKWYDEINGKYLLKINYVYQKTEQIRDGVELSLENPPGSVVLELEACGIDENGFCLWSDFVELLNSLCN